MIVSVLRLTRWEFFKVRKKWMPWILLAIAVVMTQLSLWSDYSEYRSVGRHGFYSIQLSEENVVRITCVDVVEGTVDAKLAFIPERFRVRALEVVEERRASRPSCEEDIEGYADERKRYRKGFVLPSSLANGLGVANSFGILLIMILAASAMGVEYGYGTLRTALTRGIGRWQFLGAKALSLLLLGCAGFIVVGLGVVVSSVVFASLISGDGGGLADSGQWSTVVVMFGKTVYGLAPYVILALFLSVLTSSSSMGIAFSLAYFFVESILVQILEGLFAWFGNVTDFLLSTSVTSWMIETGVHRTGGGAIFPVDDPSSQLHAFFVITAYIIILGAAAFWLFQRKDITGARGE